MSDFFSLSLLQLRIRQSCFSGSSTLSFPKNKIALFVTVVKKGKRNLTNAIFLLGSYMIFKEDMSPQRVAASFVWLDKKLLEPYRDATFTKADFSLFLVDCWANLYRGKQQGWVVYAASCCLWGKINILQYQNYDDSGMETCKWWCRASS